MERHIHQIWIGPYVLPDQEKACVRRMREVNPSVTHMLWTDDNLPDMPPNVREVFDAYATMGPTGLALQADILRILVVARFGGFYFDVDFEPRHEVPLSYFEHDYVFFRHAKTREDLTIPNGLFGGAAGSPIFEHLCASMNKASGEFWYGPSGFGQHIKAAMGLPYEVDADVVETELAKRNGVFPYYWPFCDAHAVHTGLASWQPDSRMAYTPRVNRDPLAP